MLANPNLSGGGFAARPHVLIVDDDARLRDLVARYLQDQGFVTLSADGAAAARRMLAQFSVDALIVDVMMPGEDGRALTRGLREGSDIPILLLTALGETADRITGLEAGADDYLAKPFEPRELVLRLQTILRRRAPPAKPRRWRLGRWLYDAEINELTGEGAPVRLTTAEGNLLEALAMRAGETLTRDELEMQLGAEGRTVDVQVTRLRRKLEDDPKAPRLLQTVRGRGYRLLAAPA